MLNTVILSALIGVLAGVTAAVCGVGGGIIMVPAFVMLVGLEQKEAVATSLTSIILISLLATVKNHSNSLINWPVAIACSLAGGLVAWFAADLLKMLSNQQLTRIFALLLIVVGVHMLFRK